MSINKNERGCAFYVVAGVMLAVYLLFANKVTVSYNKVDTLYMVSTIFYSAVIGMVISNNIHLGNVPFRNEMREYYRKKRNSLTLFFIITTSLYLILDIQFFLHLTSKLGINLPLLTLCVIILFILFNLLSMKNISFRIAIIEDDDLTADDVLVKQKELLEKLKDEDDPISKTKILTLIDVANNKDNENKFISPLVEKGILIKVKKSSTFYYMLKREK